MSMVNFRNVSREEEALHKAYKDLIYFGKLFLPGDFRKTEPTPEHHREMAKELLSKSQKPCAFIIQRGGAKTVLTKAKIIHNLAFAKKAHEWGFAEKEESYFFAWSSDTQRKSESNVAYVKYFLADDPNFNWYFGNLRGKVWNLEDIITCYGDKLMSTSNLTSIRGYTIVSQHEGALRYTNVFVDDPEGEKNTISENSRDRIKNTILNGILPAIEVDKPGARLFYSGTPVHEDSFCQMLLNQWQKHLEGYGGKIKANYWTDDPEELKIRQQAEKDFDWKIITYSATQPYKEKGVLWPAVYSQERLEQIKRRYRVSEKDGEAGYYQEYELEVSREEDAIIGRKALKFHSGYYEFENGRNFLIIDNRRKLVNTFIGCDPATDINTKRSDFSVILVIAIDNLNNCYVLEYERHRNIPTIGLKNEKWELVDKKGVVDWIFDLYDKYHCTHSSIEDVGMNRSIFQSLNQEKRRLNRFDLVTIPMKPSTQTDKLSRIYSVMSGRFSAGGVLVRENQYQLITEIATFGAKMGHDDTIDALHIACTSAYPPTLVLNQDTHEYHEERQPPPKDWRGYSQKLAIN